jgi:hypothetical protein
VTSPAEESRLIAYASAGHYVPVVAEPMLAGRLPGEGDRDFAARFATALRIVHALSGRAVLVVCDTLPAGWTSGLSVDGRGLLEQAALLEGEPSLP